MTITAYKIDNEYLRGQLTDYQAQVGDAPLLPLFIAQTVKVIAADRKAYLRYGPYWWSVKRVLKANDVDLGPYQEPIWADEYDIKGEDGIASPEMTLLAAWEFGDDNMGDFGVQTNEYDLDGTTFLLFDPDQAERAS